MSEPKWTKGPWKRDTRSGVGCDVRATSGRKIACTYGVANHPKGEGANLIRAVAAQKATDDANAHLIAAAPELFEALESITDYYVALVGSGDCGHWNPNNDSCVIYARSALAKALGKDSL